MFRGVVEHNRMRRIGQKSGTCSHGLENPSLSLSAQVLRNPIVFSYQAHQTCRLMNVEIVEHKMPPGHLVIGGYGTGYMIDKVHIPSNLVVGRCRRTLIASGSEDLQVEHPVCGGHTPAFHFHPTLARVQGPALVRDQVVQVRQAGEKRRLTPTAM